MSAIRNPHMVLSFADSGPFSTHTLKISNRWLEGTLVLSAESLLNITVVNAHLGELTREDMRGVEDVGMLFAKLKFSEHQSSRHKVS